MYNGLTTASQAEPRVGIAYNIQKTNTVLRLSYARTLETPFNENLVLSSTGCFYPVIAALVPCIPAPLDPGYRNEFHAGLQQAFGKYVVVSGEYIWKYTHNAYRLQRARQYADHLPHRVAQLEDSRMGVARQRAGLPRLQRAGGHVERGRALLSAADWEDWA